MPVSASRTRILGSHAAARARRTARRLARSAAASAAGEPSAGWVSGIRWVALESTTRSVSPVRRAPTTPPSTVVRVTTRGCAGSATSSSTITVAGGVQGTGDMTSDWMIVAPRLIAGPPQAPPPSAITTSRSPCSSSPVGVAPSGVNGGASARGVPSPTSVKRTAPSAIAYTTRPSVSTRSGSSTPASWTLVPEKSTPSRSGAGAGEPAAPDAARSAASGAATAS